ncbi:hypothetical protein [Mycolicibacterium sp. CBMA 226]|uniref:hypothetical protein n=1 Tax=Mycolicibacterium sp. CBMA 226 TaxID=2606611 RepID=UPI0028BE0372|nr:hypothetical protein [Mycolicibacterium sp. CBMA 226]
MVLACTAAADDHGMRALRDVATAAGDVDYRVIGGHMVRLLRHIYDQPGAPRVTSDADTGIEADISVAGSLHEQLTGLGYELEAGNRYARGELAIDLLVPTLAKPGVREVGGRAFDSTPGLRMALASPPIQVSVSARLTDGDTVDFCVPVPDVEAAFVLKVLARTVRSEQRDVTDIGTLLEIVQSAPVFLATPWRMNDPKVVGSGERMDAARVAARMAVAPPTVVPARVRALLARHVAAPRA